MRNKLLDNTGEEDEKSIRPHLISEFIGQKEVVDNLKIFIHAARTRGTALDHVLLYGPPGLGKTTISSIIAHEMQVNIRITSGPLLSKTGDLAAILTSLEPKDVLFIDEIHRLPVAVEEVLYSAMEDFKLDLVIGEGQTARTVHIDLPRFTLVGATTRIGLLTNPLRDRFGIPLRMDFYNNAELCQVVMRGAKILGVAIMADGAMEIAARARGTPRIALRILRRVADFAIYNKDEIITKQTAQGALERLGIDNLGLDSLDYKYLSYIAENFQGGPVGIETIAAGLSESRDTLEDTVEPYLMACGLLKRTPRGREITRKAYSHLGIMPYHKQSAPAEEK